MNPGHVLIAGTLSLFVLAAAAPAGAGEPRMPGVDRRQEIQQRRIGAGVAAGQLTPRETILLGREQAMIARAERRAECDGRITKRERVRLHRMQDRASRDIYRLRHNGRSSR